MRGGFRVAALLLVGTAGAAAQAAPPAAPPVQPTAQQRWSDGALAAMGAFKAGETDKAGDLMGQMLLLAEKEFGPRHQVTLTSIDFLAAIRHKQGREGEVAGLKQRALAIREGLFGFGAPETLSAANDLAVIDFQMGRFGDAEQLLNRLVAFYVDASPPNPGNLAAARGNLAAVLQKLGRYAAAEAIERALLADAETRLGPEHPETLLRLNNLGSLLKDAGLDGESEKLLARALEVRSRVLGENHPDTAASRANLAALYQSMGRIDDAALLAAAPAAGSMDPLVELNNRAGLLQGQGRFAQARALYEQVLANREQRLGPGHPDTILSGNNLARSLAVAGRSRQAEALYAKMIARADKFLGPADPVAIALKTNLASLLKEGARYQEAEALYRRALTLAEGALPKDHPIPNGIANNLAALYYSQGRYREAEALFERVAQTAERTIGSDHADTLAARNNLALVYQARGRLAEAEKIYAATLAATERLAGANGPRMPIALNNLASLYQEQGRLKEAEPLYQRAYALEQNLFGAEHPRTISSANNLALLYELEGRYAEAEPLLTAAFAANRRLLGADHPATLTSLSNLADLEHRQGRLDQAEQSYREVVERRRAKLGATHPDTLKATNNLGVVLFALRRTDQAARLFSQVLEAARARLGPHHPLTVEAAANLAFVRLSVGESDPKVLDVARSMAAALRARRQLGPDGLLGEAQRDRELVQDSSKFTLLAEADWLRSEQLGPAAATEAFSALQDAMSGSTSQALVKSSILRAASDKAPRLRALVGEREDLAQRWTLLGKQLTEGGAGNATQLAQRQTIEARVAVIDAALKTSFPDYFALTRAEAVGLADTRALLKPDEAILLVVPTLLGTQVMAITQEGATWRRSTWPENKVDQAVLRLLWDAGASVTADQETQARWQIEDGATFPYHRRIAYDLYNEIVAPVAASLAGKRHVFVAAAGALTSFPFAMLVTAPPGGRDDDPAALRATSWFADAHALVQIPSVQSLALLRQARQAPAASGFIGFGDPLLDGGGNSRGAARHRGLTADRLPKDASVAAPAVSEIGVGELRGLARLPGTAVELEEIRRNLGAAPGTLFLREKATEAAFRALDLTHTAVIALATHGLLAGEIRGFAEPGLVFTPPAVPTQEDDGFLSVSEIASLKLNADFVILSACNTAAGDGSEGAPGLSGLARAFFYAGASHLLASHWPVRDDVAARMTARILQISRSGSGSSRAEALQQVMREVRYDASQDVGNSSLAHPNAWAPFVLVGDDGR